MALTQHRHSNEFTACKNNVLLCGRVTLKCRNRLYSGVSHLLYLGLGCQHHAGVGKVPHQGIHDRAHSSWAFRMTWRSGSRGIGKGRMRCESAVERTLKNNIILLSTTQPKSQESPAYRVFRGARMPDGAKRWCRFCHVAPALPGSRSSPLRRLEQDRRHSAACQLSPNHLDGEDPESRKSAQTPVLNGD